MAQREHGGFFAHRMRTGPLLFLFAVALLHHLATAVTYPTVYISTATHSRNNVTIASLSGFPRHAYAIDAQATVTVLVPKSGLEKVSRQTQRANCCAGINGGPFHDDGSSVGVLVVDGSVRQRDENEASALVGIGYQNLTAKEESFWVLGAPPEPLESLQWFVTGFGWLVYNGTNVAPSPHEDNTGAQRAPRTAVGVDSYHQLIFVVADGCEKCAHKRGLTLHELGNHLLDLNLTYAINLDGGSSTVLIDESGKVANHPTCLDVIPFKCERAVATVFCIGQCEHESIVRVPW